MTIYEGTIITCDAANTVCRCLAEQDGKIIMVGEAEAFHRALPGAAGAKHVCLGTKALVPAFADTHIHFSSWSFFRACVDVRDSRSNETTAAMLAEAVQGTPGRDPILAYGASAHCVEEGRLLTRTDLDAALPRRPAMVFKYDGHASICNQAMLQALPTNIQRLRGMHPETGELNQEAFFRAAEYVTRHISPVRLVSGMLQGYDTLALQGIGLIHSVEGVGFPRDMDLTAALLVARGIKSPLRTRVFFQSMDVPRVLKRKLPRIGGCFATALDGCFGSEDAALLEPYSHRPGYQGVLFYDQSTVTDFCIRANRAGLQVAMHAIGDAAFRQALTALKTALAEHPREDHRHTIIHGTLVAPEDLKECARLGIAIATQSAFLNWPLEPDDYLHRLLGHRADQVLALKTMRQLGLHVSLGSDAPVTEPDPISWLDRACNHPNPAERVSVQDALAMMTREAAYMSFDEERTGSLEIGKSADMVILSGNPLAMPITRLREVRVEQLLLAGKPWAGAGSLPGMALRTLFRKRQM